jgi:hypothetical protein
VRKVWNDIGDGRELVLYLDGAEKLEFFPRRELQTQVAGQAVVRDGGVSALHITMRDRTTAVAGVLRVRTAGTVRYFTIEQ